MPRRDGALAWRRASAKSGGTASAFRLREHRRSASALAHAVHRGRKGDHEPALHELPPGEQPAHARRRHAPAFTTRHARGRRRRGTRQHLRRLPPGPERRNLRRSADIAAKHSRSSALGLAPIEMAWEGKSIGDICRQIRDPQRNGGRDLELLHEHLAKDDLVGWGWNPGAGRDPAPGTQEQLGQLFRAWIDTGAECP